MEGGAACGKCVAVVVMGVDLDGEVCVGEGVVGGGVVEVKRVVDPERGHVTTQVT